MEYIILIISLASIVFGVNYLVEGSVSIAKRLRISDFVIGATIVGIGISMPELAASVMAALKKNTQMAIGNIVGSNIFNTTCILGLSSQVISLTTSGVTLVDYTIMTVSSILLLIFGFRSEIGRIGGVFMLICFLAYNWYLITNQIA